MKILPVRRNGDCVESLDGLHPVEDSAVAGGARACQSVFAGRAQILNIISA